MKTTKFALILKDWAWWWLPLMVGTVLRLVRLPMQMLGDDEMHLLRIITSERFTWILTHYSDTDYGIPLALFFKGWMRLHLPITEMTLRLPMLISGLVLLAGLPLIIRRVAGANVARWFIWLLAIAPSFVFYSRIVRTYMPVTLLAHGSMWCFYGWLNEGKPRWAVGYVLLAALAVYWHLVAIPFVLAPLLFAAWGKWRASPKSENPRATVQTNFRYSWLRLISLGVICGGAILLLQLPTLPSLIVLGLSKSGAGTIEGATIQENLYLQAGVRWPLIMVGFWVLACGGWIYLYRLRPRLAGFTLCLMLTHLLGLSLLAPVELQAPHVFSRYIILVLPLFLVWGAAGLEGLCKVVGQRAGAVAAAILILLLFISGPFSQSAYWQTNLVHHNDFLRFNCELPTFAPENVPVFYQELAQRPPGSVTLLEYPWDWTWQYGHINLAYHLFHRQTLIGASPNIPFIADSRLSLHYLIPPFPDPFRQSTAHYLVIHQDWLAEELRLENNPCLNLPLETMDERGRDPRWSSWRTSAQEMARRLERLWGEPFYADDTVIVWDLARVRQQGH